MYFRLLLFLATLSCLPFLLGAQEVVQVQPERLFVYGDFVYPANFRGMRQFMINLHELDPEANQRMQADWQRIRQNHNLGQTIMWGSVGIGSVFFFAATIPKENVKIIPNSTITLTERDYSASTRRLTIGSIISLGGGIVGWLIARNSGDPLLFMNTFNSLSPNQKLHLSIVSFSGLGLGLYYDLD